MSCKAETVIERFRIVEGIARRDIEELQRLWSPEERLDVWNRLRSLSKWYLLECSPHLPREADRYYNGLLKLAQLKVAASFRREGSYPDIVKGFTEEEYDVVESFEAMKILDGLEVEDIVRLIERREGRIYQVVKDYYEKQFHMLERSWAPLIGDLAYVIEKLYGRRREKIEEAVIEYVRRKGLSQAILEIEEAVARIREAEEGRLEGERLVDEYRRSRGSLEELIARGRVAEAEEVLKSLESRMREVESKLERVIESLEASRGALREALEAESSAVRRELERLRGEREKLERLSAALEIEREKLRRAVRGESKGHASTMSEVKALIAGLSEKVRARLESGVEVLDARRYRRVRLRGWAQEPLREELGDVVAEGYRFVKYEGVIFRRPRVQVEVAVLYRKSRMESGGVDYEAIGLGPVADMVKSRLGSEGYVIMVLASPTGFDEAARSFVEGGRIPPIASRIVTVYLVDPVEQRLYYNRGDEAARANAGIAGPLLEEEEVEKVLAWLVSEEARKRALRASPVRPFLLASEVAEILGVGEGSVVEAFKRLESQGRARVVEVEGRVALLLSGG